MENFSKVKMLKSHALCIWLTPLWLTKSSTSLKRNQKDTHYTGTLVFHEQTTMIHIPLFQNISIMWWQWWSPSRKYSLAWLNVMWNMQRQENLKISHIYMPLLSFHWMNNRKFYIKIIVSTILPDKLHLPVHSLREYMYFISNLQHQLYWCIIRKSGVGDPFTTGRVFSTLKYSGTFLERPPHLP